MPRGSPPESTRTPLDFPRTSRASRTPQNTPNTHSTHRPSTSPSHTAQSIDSSQTHHHPIHFPLHLHWPPTKPSTGANPPESHKEGEKNPNSLRRPIFLKRRIKRGGRGLTPSRASPDHHEVACTPPTRRRCLRTPLHQHHCCCFPSEVDRPPRAPPQVMGTLPSFAARLSCILVFFPLVLGCMVPPLSCRTSSPSR